MKYKEFHLRDFRAGYIENQSAEVTPDNAIVRGSFDVDLSVDGAVRTRKGYSKVLTDATTTTHVETNDLVSETLGVHQFFDPGNIRCLVRIARAADNSSTGGLFSSGDVCIEYNTSDFPGTISGTGWVLAQSGGVAIKVATSVSAEKYVDFADYKGRLYIACPGTTDVKYLTYSSGFTVNTVTDSSGAPSGINKPKGIEAWYDRIWAYMDESVDNGSYLVWTDTAGTTFGADNYVEIPGRGPITGLARIGRNMLVFKSGETFLLSGGDDPTNNLRVETLSREVGCIARRSIVVVESGCYWLSERGIMYCNGQSIAKVSDNISFQVGDIDRSQLEKSHAVHNAAQDHVVFFFPFAQTAGVGYGEGDYGDDYGNGSYVVRAFAYDYNAGSWCAPFTNQDFIASCVYTNSTDTTIDAEEIVIACRTDTYNSHVMHWYNGTDDDGGELSGVAVTKPYDLGDPGMHKIVRKIYSQLGEIGSSTVRIELFSNYDTIDDTTDTASTVVTRTTSEGADDNPKYIQERHVVGMNSKHVRFRVTMTGPCVLAGIVALYATKGRRA